VALPKLTHLEQAYLFQLKNDLALLASKEIDTLRMIDRIRSVHTNHRSEVKRDLSRAILVRQFCHLPFTFGLAAIRVAAIAALKKEREQEKGTRASDKMMEQQATQQQPKSTVPSFYDFDGASEKSIPEHELLVIRGIAKKFGRFTTEAFVGIVLEERAADVTNRFGFVNRAKSILTNSRPELGPSGPFDREKKGKMARPMKDGTGGVEREGDDWIPAEMPQRFSYFMGNQKCNTPVQPPTTFDNTLLKTSGQLPHVLVANKRREVGLELEHVHGYRGNHPGQNLFINCQGNLVFYAAATGIVQDSLNNKQRFFTEHDEDITSMAIDPTGVFVATGQLKGAGVGGERKEACVIVWDSTHDPPMKVFDFKIGRVKLEETTDTFRKARKVTSEITDHGVKTGELFNTITAATRLSAVREDAGRQFPFYDRAIGAIAFGPAMHPCGSSILVATGEDDRHTLGKDRGEPSVESSVESSAESSAESSVGNALTRACTRRVGLGYR
jgi:hypothetical protein